MLTPANVAYAFCSFNWYEKYHEFDLQIAGLTKNIRSSQNLYNVYSLLIIPYVIGE